MNLARLYGPESTRYIPWFFAVPHDANHEVPIIDFIAKKYLIPAWLNRVPGAAYEDLLEYIERAHLYASISTSEWPEFSTEAFHADDEFGGSSEYITLQVTKDGMHSGAYEVEQKIDPEDIIKIQKLLEHCKEVYRKALDSYLADKGVLER